MTSDGVNDVVALCEADCSIILPDASLFFTTAIGFYVAALLFHKLLELSAIPSREIVIILILAVISYLLIFIIIKRKVYKKKQIG